jgi:hypothetical protein
MTRSTDPSDLPAMADSTETPLEPETPEVIVWDEPPAPEPVKQHDGNHA